MLRAHPAALLAQLARAQAPSPWRWQAKRPRPLPLASTTLTVRRAVDAAQREQQKRSSRDAELEVSESDAKSARRAPHERGPSG